MGDDGDGVNVPIPNVGVPTKDNVLETTDQYIVPALIGGSGLIAALLVIMVLKKILANINYKFLALVLLILFLAAFYGTIGKH